MDQKEQPKYATLFYETRQQLAISWAEYALLEMVYHLSYKAGYCFKAPSSIALDLGITKRGVNKMITRLAGKGLLERLTNDTLRVTPNYIDIQSGNKVPTKNFTGVGWEQSSRKWEQSSRSGNKVPKKQGDRIIVKNNNENKEPKGSRRVSDETATIKRLYLLYLELFDSTESRYKLTDKRRSRLRTRIRDAGPALIEAAIRYAAADPFYRGDNDRAWKADLDWLTGSYEKIERLANKGAADSQTKIPSTEEAINGL